MAAVAALRRLVNGFDGRLLLPDDDEYFTIRRDTIAGLDEPLPAAVARCATVRDVARTIEVAREYDLPVAIRGGGHSFADFSSTGGLLIDLAPMNSIAVTDGGRPNAGGTVTVGPGVRIAALADRLAAHDRLSPSGWCPTVGVVGAVLGGGYGRFGRHFGLGCDHLLAADVVLADGRLIRADAEQNADLYWALRGAGNGHFGVVSSVVLRTRPAPTATMFAHLWTYEHAARVVACWQEWAPTTDDTVNAELVLAVGADPATIPMVILFGAVVGAAQRCTGLLDRFVRQVGVEGRRWTVTELTGRMAARHHSFAGMAQPTESPPAPPPGQRPRRRVLRSGFFNRPLSGAAIAELVDRFVAGRVPGQYRELEFVPWGGAYRRVPAGGTAFVHRDPLFLLALSADVSADAGDAARHGVHDWVTRRWAAIRPWAGGGVYPNYPDLDLPDGPNAYHGDSLDRLMAVKARYDPSDLFHFAQSIPLPTV